MEVPMLSAALLSICLLAPDPIAATSEALPFDPDSWKATEKAKVEVTEGGRKVIYAGVPLRVVLGDRVKEGQGAMRALRDLSDAVLLVRAEDGYRVAVSAAAVAMDAQGERYLLATERDGKPLDERQGPVRLIVPGDAQHVRWVRMVKGVDLIRFQAAKADR
jgi:hypothetical protein